MPITITGHDANHLRKALADRLDDEHDDGGPDVVMLSIGYVELWRDGEITSHGCRYEAVDPDSDLLTYCHCGWPLSAVTLHDSCDDTTIELDRVTS